MRKMWLVASTTYRERLRSGMFLILTLGVPLLMILAGVVGFLTASGDEGEVPSSIGYVDNTGVYSAAQSVRIEESLLEIDESLQFAPYPDQRSAETAYLDGEIGGYLVIPENYSQGEAITYFTDGEAGAIVEEGIRIFLRRGALEMEGASEWVLSRLDDVASYTYVGQASGEAVSQGPGLIIRLLTPAFLAAAFVLTVLFGTSQMGTAIIREKEQRAMEIVVTSLRPLELVAGKILGLSLLSLTQIGIWLTGGIIALYLAFSDQISLQGLVIPWESLLWGVLLIVPGYLLFAILAAGLGIIAGDSQQAQQLAGIMSLLGLAPLYVLTPILMNPDGPLAVALTLFPLTSPSVTLMRTVFTAVPTWQLAAALGIILLSLALGIWVVTRIFRAAMLSYGQALGPRQIWRALVQA